MSATSDNNKRIAKNTVILYCRMFLMLVIGLFTSRVILQTLGVEDYGIYNAVGGIVVMFGLLSGAITNAVNRFLAFELGRGDKEKLKRVFSTSLNVMLIFSLFIIILGATLGVWFLNCRMVIPEGRMSAANWVLACSVLTFTINLISIPYNAAIVAHEKMSAFAYISLIEAALKLAIVYTLYIIPFDKLKTYAVLYLCLAFLIRFLYGVYCKRHFAECTYHLIHDKALLKQMTSFAGWNFLGNGAYMINNAGINLLMNLFFGVTVNAARGIAVQVNSHVYQFVTNFTMAVNPQITKSYAKGDYEYMHSLVIRGSKFSFFLILFFLIPICLEAHQILHIWLGIVPDYAVPFIQITMISTAINTLTNSVIVATHATGNIRRFMITCGAVEIVTFPLVYIAFKLGATPMAAYYINTTIVVILIFVRLFMAKDLIHMKASTYIKAVFLKAFIVGMLSFILPMISWVMMEECILRLIIVCVVSCISSISIIYIIGLNQSERVLILSFIKKKIMLNRRRV